MVNIASLIEDRSPVLAERCCQVSREMTEAVNGLERAVAEAVFRKTA